MWKLYITTPHHRSGRTSQPLSVLQQVHPQELETTFNGCGFISLGRGTWKFVFPAWRITCDGKGNHFATVHHSARVTTASGLVVHVVWDVDKEAFKPTMPSYLACFTINVSLIATKTSANQDSHHDASAHPDTGAQVSVAGPSLLVTMGHPHDCLRLHSKSELLEAFSYTSLVTSQYSSPFLMTVHSGPHMRLYMLCMV